jgi:thioredoxin-related protein
MRIFKLMFFVFLTMFFVACNDTKQNVDVKFKSIKSFEEVPQDKMTFLFLSKPGCKWCAKLKEDFKNFEYIKKYPQYEYIKIESDEPLFKQFQATAFRVTSFPTVLILQRSSKEFIVVEKIEGYSKPDVLEPILEFNKDLVNK